MPIPSTPSIMPNVLGYAADTVQIPETTPTGQGIPSFRELFPFITQVDPDAGGVMVERAWMNALFNLLGQHAFFQQSGCVYPWQATLNYIAGSHVKGSDDVEYIALQRSGPDVSGTGAKDPTLEANRNYWISLSSFVSGDFVPDSRRVIAGTGLTGGGPLSSDVTLAAKLDGKTTQAAADGAITVKDVAIGGALGDLASARGQIGNNIRINTASDLNAYTKSGNWLFSDAAAGKNFPNIGRGGELNCYASTTAIFQFFTEFNNNRRYIRYGIPNSTWTNWIQFISVAQLGDGIRNTNGIISVPEYEGATASAAGTSGLVPPAAAGQHKSFLTGGGEYKPALTKISDSVSLTDSTTAASATAVKSAYNRGTAGVTAAGEAKTTAEKALTVANSKQPNLGFTPVQQGGGSGQDNSKIYIGHGTNGLKAQIGTTDLGYIVTTAAGTTKAANSASADRAQVAGSAETLFVTGWGNTKWGSTPYGQSPLYVWCLPSGGSDMMPCSPGVLSAGAANFCTYTPNVRVGTDGSVLPAGGTWRIMTSRNGEGTIMDLAGGSTVSTAGGVFMAIRVA